MGRFAIGRIVQGVVVVFLVTVVVFVTTRMVGDPVKVMLPFESTPQQRAVFKHRLGFDRPVHGDFGTSLQQNRSTISIVGERLPATMELVAAGMIFAILLSVPLGTIAALRP